MRLRKKNKLHHQKKVFIGTEDLNFTAVHELGRLGIAESVCNLYFLLVYHKQIRKLTKRLPNSMNFKSSLPLSKI
jgi:hypothetical protein